MSVSTKVLFVASALFAVAGAITGWLFQVPGSGGHTAWELVNTEGMGAFGATFYKGQVALGTPWMVVAWALLAVGAVLFVVAVVAAFWNLSDQNRKLQAARYAQK